METSGAAGGRLTGSIFTAAGAPGVGKKESAHGSDVHLRRRAVAGSRRLGSTPVGAQPEFRSNRSRRRQMAGREGHEAYQEEPE